MRQWEYVLGICVSLLAIGLTIFNVFVNGDRTLSALVFGFLSVSISSVVIFALFMLHRIRKIRASRGGSKSIPVDVDLDAEAVFAGIRDTFDEYDVLGEGDLEVLWNRIREVVETEVLKRNQPLPPEAIDFMTATVIATYFHYTAIQKGQSLG